MQVKRNLFLPAELPRSIIENSFKTMHKGDSPAMTARPVDARFAAVSFVLLTFATFTQRLLSQAVIQLQLAVTPSDFRNRFCVLE